MSIVKAEDGKKWINSFIAVCALLMGYMTIQFVEQLGEWFDLEAKVGNFLAVTQGAGIVIGLITFISVAKNKKAQAYLNEAYNELTKVIWPDKDSVFKLTIGLVIGLSIVSSIFVAIDYLFVKILEMLY